MDPRIAERRTEVREGSARGDARRLLRWFSVLAIVAIVAWVAQLPAFSVQAIEVSGSVESDVESALEATGVVPGTPLVLVRAGTVETALEADPWVVDARVAHAFPDTIVVEVDERTAVVNIRSGGRVQVVSADGVAVSEVTDPLLPTVELAGVARTTPGAAVTDDRAAGIAEFFAVMPAQLVDAGTMTEADGELWFELPGTDVRLGRAVDMAAKAYALDALIAEGVAPGSVIHLVSASRPAVEPPVATTVDGEDEPADGTDGAEAP